MWTSHLYNLLITPFISDWNGNHTADLSQGKKKSDWKGIPALERPHTMNYSPSTHIWEQLKCE